MGVYIKGMEMPKNCLECPIVVCTDVKSDCPLVPVPPHGRLIDADALEYHADNVRDPMGRTEKIVMWKKIESAQTILPAEGVE